MLYVYPGTALILLRSYTEHQPAAEQAQRTAIVEAGPLMRLLFLGNNFHALHHERPGIAWYDLPQVYRAERERVLADNGVFLFAGYGDIVAALSLAGEGFAAAPRPGRLVPIRSAIHD